MTAALTYHTVTLEPHECKTCGVVFGMSETFVQARKNDHVMWYCPNGHSWYYPAASDLEKERQRRIRAEARAVQAEDYAEALKRSRAAAKGQLTKLRNRIANGVCPWCKRSFSNVLAHVEHQHPEQLDRAKEAAS